MEFRILGPVEALDEDGPLPIAAGKERALLALLLLHANSVVARDRLVDDLWADNAPASAAKMIQVYVSHLRRAIREPRLHTRGSGYALDVGPDELDLTRFEGLLSAGREALGRGDALGAARLLRESLAIWRGPALVDVSEPFASLASARLEEERVTAVETRLAADLELGRHADVIGELEGLARQHPLRERLRELQMLALQRSSRQAEALAAYESFRRLLSDELGLEPAASLKDLQRRILRQDPALSAPTESRPAVAREMAPTEPGDVRFADSDGVRIAYQVVGEGPLDLVLVHGWVCTFEPGWENSRMASFYRGLAHMGRLILFDKRGTGLSDRFSPSRLPDLETRMDDVRVVMDAVGSDRAVVLGVSEGGSMSTLFAAIHPERTVALVLMGTFARTMRSADYPVGTTDEEYEHRLAVLEDEAWVEAVTAEWLGRVAPGLVDDEAAVRWYESYVRRGASPTAIRAIRTMNREIDIRDVLPTISVPTLVLYRAGEYAGERTRFMGTRVSGARVVALPGDDHLPWEGDQSRLLGEISDFLAGAHEKRPSDRVLATLLFTDIVGSTAKAAELGDSRWHDLLERHHEVVRSRVARFRGREVGTAGDGVLAMFDGPARAVRCAVSIAGAVRALGLEVRAGVHTGEIQRHGDDVRGIAVHIAARVMEVAEPGGVLVSSTVKDIVAGSGITFEARGEHELAGVPERWRLYAPTPD